MSMEEKEKKVKVKRKRPDVAARIQANKDKQFVCVKTYFNQFLPKNTTLEGINLQEIICRFVYKLNIIKRLSFDLLNYEFTYRLENNLELPKINQNLFYKACCAVSFRSDDWKEDLRYERRLT